MTSDKLVSESLTWLLGLSEKERMCLFKLSMCCMYLAFPSLLALRHLVQSLTDPGARVFVRAYCARECVCVCVCLYVCTCVCNSRGLYGPL